MSYPPILYDGCFGVTFGRKVYGPFKRAGGGFIADGLADGENNYCTDDGAVFVPGCWPMISRYVYKVFDTEQGANAFVLNEIRKG